MKRLFFCSVLIGFSISRVIAQDPQNMKVENQKLDCERMTTNFSNINEAVENLNNSVFAFRQELKTTKPNGIKRANYFTCDNEKGFLLLAIDDNLYVYKEYPRFKWKLLIESNDLDEFYEDEIEGKFALVVSGKIDD